MWFLKLIGLLVPRIDEPGGEPTNPSGGEPAINAEDDAVALGRAAELEAANQRITELEMKESEFDSRVNTEAQRLLDEVMPEVSPQLSAPAPHPFQRQTQPQYFEQPPGGEGGEELTEEQQVVRDVQATRMEVEQLRAERDSDRVTQTMNAMQKDYPHMDRFRVQAFMAQQQRPDQINLRKLCQISNEKELAAKTAYAEQHHAAKMAEISKGPAPPPSVPRGAGTPNDGVTITRANASAVLAERLEARGYGKR